jgi:hypothetical protein
MNESSYQLEVKPDFIARQSKSSVETGLAELIWNAFDADAKSVSVELVSNPLGIPEGLVVKDDGTGFHILRHLHFLKVLEVLGKVRAGSHAKSDANYMVRRAEVGFAQCQSDPELCGKLFLKRTAIVSDLKFAWMNPRQIMYIFRIPKQLRPQRAQLLPSQTSKRASMH